MEIFFLPKEAVLLEFKRINGSGWLTNYRLILCEHSPGQLEGHEPVMYLLEEFKKAQIKESSLIVHFKGKPPANIRLPNEAPAILQEIKSYIEKAAKR